MNKRDYVGGVDQAAVSTRSIDFHESGVYDEWQCRLAEMYDQRMRIARLDFVYNSTDLHDDN